ncbi:glycoside hydrolase family 5 protein [Cytophagaceae bacterium ABcell3]|nr:glycoside hydrolase family 5 protein [Cytophagaceae bacterium ABcell3]
MRKPTNPLIYAAICLMATISLALLFHSCRKQEVAPREEEIIIPTNTPSVQRHGQLSVSGNKIIGEHGGYVQLQGMSLFWSQWSDGAPFYNKEIVKYLRDEWRCTVVRAAMAVEYGGYLTNPEREKEKVKTIIDAAIENDIYVIVDWHDHNAHDPTNTEAAKEFFAEIAQEYGHYPHIIYEPYNEPLDVSWSATCKPYFEEIIEVIRKYDKNNIIACGTPLWSQRVDQAAMDPLDDPNVAYVLHYYAGTHRNRVMQYARDALRLGVALMVTEYGTVNADGDGSVSEAWSQNWWTFMNENHISGCNWSITDKNEGSAALKRAPNPDGGGTVRPDPTGGWEDYQITESGHLVKAYLRSRNPVPEENTDKESED